MFFLAGFLSGAVSMVIDATFHLPVIVNDSSIEEAASRVREVLDGANTPYPAVEVARQRASRKYEGQLELH